MLTPFLQPLADAWALDTAVKPYKWQAVQATGEAPCARMYAAAAARADGLLLLCGGRDVNNAPLVRCSTSRGTASFA
jgi:protein phosphatase